MLTLDYSEDRRERLFYLRIGSASQRPETGSTDDDWDQNRKSSVQHELSRPHTGDCFADRITMSSTA